MALLSRRIIVPLLLALGCSALFGGILWWQLLQARILVTGTIIPTLTSAREEQGASPDDLVIDASDAVLLRLRKGDIFALQGEWAKATEEFTQALKEGGGLTTLRKLAHAQMQRRDIEGARGTIENIKRTGGRSEDLLLLEVLLGLRTGEIAHARSLLESAEDSPHKHYGLALLAITEERYDDVKVALSAVIGGWDPLLRANARTLAAAYDEYLLFPESPQIHLETLLARALAQTQECELALPLLSRVTQQQDDYRDAWMLQGYCELLTERFAEALASLERAYSLDPEKPEIQYFLARTYAAQGDHIHALVFFDYALQNGFEPQREVRRRIANSSIETGDIARAFEQYDAITQLPDTTIDTVSEFVSFAITAGRKEEAHIRALEATQKWPDQAEAFSLLGWAALETDRGAEAKAALEKALSLDPTHVQARERLGNLEL